jgi:signal transduction histidine kinase
VGDRRVGGRAPAAVAVLVLGASLLAARFAAQAAARDSLADAAAEAAPAVAAFQAALGRAVAALAAPSPPGAGFEPAGRLEASGGALGAVALVGATDRTVRTDGTAPARDPALPAARDPALPPGTDLAATPEARATFDLAADAGLVQASPPVRLGAAGRRVLLVAPRYRPGEPVRSVAERRAALAGFVVGTVDVERLGARLFGPAVRGGVEVRDGPTVLFRHGPTGGREALRTTLEPGGERAWTVVVSAPAPGLAFPGALAGGGAVVALVVAAVAARLTRARDAALAGAEARARDLGLVVEAGELLHRSLDLAEVLPALAVVLTDRLGLSGLAVLLADDGGRLVEVFGYGARPRALPAQAADLSRAPAHPGEAWVPLLRGGRALGALWVGAEGDLDPTRLAAVRAVGEALGSAVANAAAYRREQETARRLQEVDALKTDFLSTASHELRTPVTAIRGFATILEGSWERLGDEQRRDLVARIARNAGSLTSLVNDLLDFARLERRSLQVQVEPVDLAAVVAAVVDQTATLVDDHTIALDARAGVRALADPHAVERILANLLTNAAKFSPPGSTIRVAVAEEAGRATLTVDDEGPGVPPGERRRIFARFYRGPSDQAARTRGAGVGLAVVAELAERLGATVTVGDAPGGGARFSVSFVTPATEPAAPRRGA